jgi:hypothetical protein
MSRGFVMWGVCEVVMWGKYGKRCCIERVGGVWGVAGGAVEGGCEGGIGV